MYFILLKFLSVSYLVVILNYWRCTCTYLDVYSNLGTSLMNIYRGHVGVDLNSVSPLSLISSQCNSLDTVLCYPLRYRRKVKRPLNTNSVNEIQNNNFSYDSKFFFQTNLEEKELNFDKFKAIQWSNIYKKIPFLDSFVSSNIPSKIHNSQFTKYLLLFMDTEDKSSLLSEYENQRLKNIIDDPVDFTSVVPEGDGLTISDKSDNFHDDAKRKNSFLINSHKLLKIIKDNVFTMKSFSFSAIIRGFRKNGNISKTVSDQMESEKNFSTNTGLLSSKIDSLDNNNNNSKLVNTVRDQFTGVTYRLDFRHLKFHSVKLPEFYNMPRQEDKTYIRWFGAWFIREFSNPINTNPSTINPIRHFSHRFYCKCAEFTESHNVIFFSKPVVMSEIMIRVQHELNKIKNDNLSKTNVKSVLTVYGWSWNHNALNIISKMTSSDFNYWLESPLPLILFNNKQYFKVWSFSEDINPTLYTQPTMNFDNKGTDNSSFFFNVIDFVSWPYARIYGIVFRLEPRNTTASNISVSKRIGRHFYQVNNENIQPFSICLESLTYHRAIISNQYNTQMNFRDSLYTSLTNHNRKISLIIRDYNTKFSHSDDDPLISLQKSEETKHVEMYQKKMRLLIHQKLLESKRKLLLAIPVTTLPLELILLTENWKKLTNSYLNSGYYFISTDGIVILHDTRPIMQNASIIMHRTLPIEAPLLSLIQLQENQLCISKKIPSANRSYIKMLLTI